MPAMSTTTYDVCLSFAGEQRAYVERVAEQLRPHVSVFYDRYETVALWGRNLYEHLDEIYRMRARYCVIFISQDYARKVWTNHERQSAQARALEENREYILPVRFDETLIPGLLPTIGYIDIGQMPPERLAELILAKLSSAPPGRTVDLAADVLDEANRAELIREKPRGWEYMLFASYLKEGQATLEPKKRDSYLHYAQRVARVSSPLEVADLLSGAMEEVPAITASLMRAFKPESQEWAFGAPGEAGDPGKIEHLAATITRSTEELLDWASRLRGTVVPRELNRLVELAAQFVNNPIREISDFVEEYCSNARRIPELLSGHVEGRPPIELHSELVLTVDEQTTEEYDAEMNRVMRKLRI